MDIAGPYYDNCSNVSSELWTRESSDDKSFISMQRRNPVRRQRNVLDEDQTKDAIKLLEKYVKRKYRHSTFLSQDAGDLSIDQAGTPTGHTQSAYQLPRQITNPAERLSHIFNSTALGNINLSDNQYPPPSPVFPGNPETSFRSEMKFKEKETWYHWLSRIIKLLYYDLGFQYVVLAVFMIAYACIGGYMFMILEYDYQANELREQSENLTIESVKYATTLLKNMTTKGCLRSALSDDCISMIRQSIINRSLEVERSIKGSPWIWDFWGSVFFAATIFTTIGYGNLACKTPMGRIATIIYGLIGIPLGLAVLKKYGEFSIHQAQKVRVSLKNYFRSCATKKGLKRTATVESIESDDIKENEDSEQSYDSTSFPLRWALLLVFLFIFICSFIVSFFEKWDFLTAVYFFFVSLSTIGFGDIIPENPRTACGLFILYFLGLALFSMVYAILQERVENRYMWALELIDLEYQETQKYEMERIQEEELDNFKKSGVNNRPTKHTSTTNRPESERRFSVFTPGEPPQYAPPVLGALLMHNVSMKKKLLARSESILNKKGSKRVNSLFPSNEMLSTPANSSRGGSPWLLNCEINNPKEPTMLGKSSGLSAPNLAPGNRSPSGALSVITEASDEDSRNTKMNLSSIRRFLPRMQKEVLSESESRESLDQILEELQLEPQETDQSTTPKPYQTRKSHREVATSSEKTPFASKDEDDGDISN
ncbi:unnamed protein product [Caenorhabditis angaria]|uniref:Potassium channel domain-containing protein n=1 Tax=Caenorhabditis angaria TaxID=860376 RepID=A0A9P1J257_9PELO|nr:unnamed protein product [Caenorhabditis angaria]